MLRKLLVVAMFIVAMAAYGVTPQEAVGRFAQASGLPHGSMAVLVTDLSSGKVLASYNAELPLTPASIMKCVTLASLSEVEDVEKSISTPVTIDGKIDHDGILHGNLVIVGQGDPSLNSRIWPESEDFLNEILKALRDRGIRSVEGSIVVDDSFFAGEAIPPSWASGDLPHAYGTGSHAFNYSNNSVGKSAVRDPAAAFRSDLRRRLEDAGISVGDNPLNGWKRTPLMAHQSPQLKEIMRSCMMRSDNLFAETSLRLFGKACGGDGSTADAAAREYDFWKGKRRVCLDDVRIIDGSGLSRSNRVTARFMENVLRRKGDDVEYVSFFPLAGQEGTLKKFPSGTRLDSYVALKTGSMNGIQCYAGYKLDDDFAPTHVVVVMVNDFSCSRQHLRQEVERMLLDVFSDPRIANQKYKTPQKNIHEYAD